MNLKGNFYRCEPDVVASTIGNLLPRTLRQKKISRQGHDAEASDL
jgi:hypothetical protein